VIGRIFIAFVILMAASTAAVADEVIATQPLALVARGVAASYERSVSSRLSGVIHGAFRSAAGEDFDSSTTTLGGELRIWKRDGAAMRGLYLGLRASVGRTRLIDEVMGPVGASTTLTERVDLGWRWVIRNRFAIAPAIGLALHQQTTSSGRLAPGSQGSIGIGLELGWMR
jgi:hypothetical protein